MKSLAFFFPYHVVSGCPVLFLNVARKMVRLYPYEYKLYVVDYDEGYMASNISGEDNISVISFRDGEKCLVDTDYIIMQAYLPDAIRPELVIGKNTKVLFWVLHAWNFFPIVLPFNFFRGFIESHEDLYCRILKYAYPGVLRKYRRFLEKLKGSHSVAFMDKPTLDTTKRALSLSNFNDPDIIPIASSDPTGERYAKTHDDESIHLGWVGRLCDFKIHILNCAMKQARKYADTIKQRVIFHVVGNGELEHLLYQGESEFFKVDWVGSVKKEDLDRYMMENFDINFAMGTSVIESAKLGIPTVKCDFSYVPISDDYVFRWFHETKDYDVGHRITDVDIEVGNGSFAGIINEYKKRREELGSQDYAFYEANFSLSVVSKMLHGQLQSITSSWGEMPEQLIKRGFIRRVYYKRKYGIN